jgi:hypothetical protein
MRYQVLVAVNIKIAVFWNITACSSVDGYLSFIGTQCFHLVSVTMEAAGFSETSHDVGKIRP